QKRTFDDEHHGGRLDDLSLFEGEWSLLPNEYRDIMYFVHICDLEYRDAARRMGVSKSQAWLLGQKGRRLFQFLLDFDPESFQKAKENDFLLYLAGINGFNANELVLLSSIYGYEYKTINYVARQAGIERTTALAWAEGRFRVTTLPRGYHPLNFTPEPDKAIGSLRQRKGELRNTLDYVSGVTGEPYSTLKRWAKRGVFEIEDIGEGHIPRYVVVDKQAIAKIELEREILNNSLHKVAIMTGMDTRTLLKLSSQGLFKVYDRGERFSKGSAPRYYVDNIDEVVQVVAGR
ncbi:MAG: hypothetical protein KKC75_05005, partial [Nanoarchaeota archaeon]|nr:hypothetical protein [Nanoarchaeota archaeon]MBU1946068.1 hypothetical protein [Nanoarchaeota archaeon]